MESNHVTHTNTHTAHEHDDAPHEMQNNKVSIIKVIGILILSVLLIDIGLSLVFHAGLAPLGIGHPVDYTVGCGLGNFFCQ